MEKKIKIVFLSIILFLLIILLIVTDKSKNKEQKDNSNAYICKNVQEVVDVNMTTTYYVYNEGENIKTIEINKIYKGSTEKALENIATYRYIIGAETNQYAEYEGFASKVNKDSKKEYNYTYTFDVSTVNSELASLFGIHDNMTEQKEYFINNEYVCE